MKLKNKILTSVLFLGSLASFAQENPEPDRIYKNEFGIDATGFVKQFLNFNQGQFVQQYYPNYILTYRRFFEPGNIRFAIGGNFSDEEIPSPLPEDPNKYYHSYYSIDARLGWEFVSELSKRWQAFYGLDLRTSQMHNKDDASYFASGYAHGNESQSMVYGAGPILGFRFKLNDRVSLTTETGFSVNWQQFSGRRYYTAVSDQFPELPDDETPRANKISSGFSQPLSLIFTFNF